MKIQRKSGEIFSAHKTKKQILRLDDREIRVLKEAQRIAEKIRFFVGENERIINLKAATVEHGISDLLDRELVLEAKEIKELEE